MALIPKSVPQRDFARICKLVYGFPKTGKTTLLSLCRDSEGRPPLFLMTEEGAGELDIQKLLVTNWDGWLRCIKYLEDNKAAVQAEHSGIVIDVIADIDDYATAKVCDEHKVRALADLEYGKGQAIQKQYFRQAMQRVMAILPVSYIAHTGEREINYNGEKIKTQAPSLAKNCFEFVNGKVDAIMWIAPATTKKEYPEIIIQNTHTAIAGSRFPQLVRNFRYDPKNPAAAMKAIEDAFRMGAPSQLFPATPTPAVMETPT